VTNEQAKDLWCKQIYKKSKEVDPEGNLDPESIAIGFFIALGISPDNARLIYDEILDEGKY